MKAHILEYQETCQRAIAKLTGVFEKESNDLLDFVKKGNDTVLEAFLRQEPYILTGFAVMKVQKENLKNLADDLKVMCAGFIGKMEKIASEFADALKEGPEAVEQKFPSDGMKIGLMVVCQCMIMDRQVEHLLPQIHEHFEKIKKRFSDEWITAPPLSANTLNGLDESYIRSVFKWSM